MSTRIHWAPFAAAVLLGSPPAGAHQGDRVIPIPQLATADVEQIDLHDGSSADWQDLLGPPALTARDFPSPWRDAASGIDFRIWLAWLADPVRLYVALEVVDDQYLPDDPLSYNGMPADGRFDLLVDGDHSGYPYDGDPRGRYKGIDEKAQRYALYTAPVEMYRSRNLLCHLELMWGVASWYTDPPLADAGVVVFGESPTVIQNEFYVTPYDLLLFKEPGESQPSDWKPGSVVHLNLSYWDRDDGRLSGFQLGNDLIGLVDFLLLPLSAQRDGGDAPQLGARSWARIKATFLNPTSSGPAARPSSAKAGAVPGPCRGNVVHSGR